MQLLVLKLNTGIGRTLGHVATLQRENAQLNIEDSMYSSENRVAPFATAARYDARAGRNGPLRHCEHGGHLTRGGGALQRRSDIRERDVPPQALQVANPPARVPAVKLPSQTSDGAEASGSGEDSSSSTAGSTGESAAGSGETQSPARRRVPLPSSTGSSTPAEALHRSRAPKPPKRRHRLRVLAARRQALPPAALRPARAE